MSRRTLAFVALLATWPSAFALAGSLVLDPLTTPFVAPDCLVDTGHWVLFTNRFCPGTCPPDEYLVEETCGSGIVVNFDLRLPISPDRGLFRCFQLAADVGPDDDVSLEMLPAERAFDVRDRAPGRWWFTMSWQSTAWDLDLAGRGVTALRIPLAGEVDDGRPLYVTAIVESDAVPHNRQVVLAARASAAGDLVLPFAGPAPTHVIGVTLLFGDCPFESDNFCHATPGFGPRRYRIGAPSFDTSDATPIGHGSWGALKARYR